MNEWINIPGRSGIHSSKAHSVSLTFVSTLYIRCTSVLSVRNAAVCLCSEWSREQRRRTSSWPTSSPTATCRPTKSQRPFNPPLWQYYLFMLVNSVACHVFDTSPDYFSMCPPAVKIKCFRSICCFMMSDEETHRCSRVILVRIKFFILCPFILIKQLYI